MLLDVAQLNLKFEHVKGIKNCTVDFRSRRPRDSFEAVSEEDIPVKLRLGIRTVKAQKLQVEPIDPRVERLAELAKSDTKYQRMIFHTEEDTPNKYIEKDSELFKNGSERKHLGIFVCKNGNKLLVRNSEEVIIPERARGEVLTELHSTHLSSDGMKRLARGKFHWSGMGKEIEKLHNGCVACKENSRSKPNIPGKRNEVNLVA